MFEEDTFICANLFKESIIIVIFEVGYYKSCFSVVSEICMLLREKEKVQQLRGKRERENNCILDKEPIWTALLHFHQRISHRIKL